MLTILASVVTVFVQGFFPKESIQISASDVYFSYELVTETEESSTYLLRVISRAQTAGADVSFIYPGTLCTPPAFIEGTGEITESHLAYEWQYTTTCSTNHPLPTNRILFDVI